MPMLYPAIQYGMAGTPELERAGPGWARCMDRQRLRVQAAREALDQCVAALSPEARQALERASASPHTEIPVPDGFEAEEPEPEQGGAAADDP
eukprot:11176579-Lingulodinium_polyedra.AAC.1